MDINNVNDYVVGMVIGDMTVESLDIKTPATSKVTVRCNECGAVKTISVFQAKKGSFKHSMMKCDKRPLEEKFPIGMVIEDMTIVGYDTKLTSADGNRKDLLVKCNVCSSTKTIQVGNLMNNKHCCSHKTCSYVKRMDNDIITQHPSLYNIWRVMCNRVYNETGTLCDYALFEEFLNDLGPSYYQHVSMYGENDTTLVRINESMGYIKNNLTWCRISESYNRSKEQFSFYACSPDKKLYVSDNQSAFAKNHNLNQGNVSTCLNRGGTTLGWRFSKINPMFIPVTESEYVIDERDSYI